MNLNNSRNKSGSGENDEVEQMLREAEDEMMLKLSTNSHLAHLSSNLPSDLERRYQGLKSGSKRPDKPVSSTTTDSTRDHHQPPPVVSVENVDDIDPLFARFASLKASLPKPSSSADYSSSYHGNLAKPDAPPAVQIGKITHGNGNGNAAVAEGSSNDDEDDEVEKLIKWAMDAARLDPSPPSDDDEADNDDTDFEDDVSESSDDEGDDKPKKRKR